MEKAKTERIKQLLSSYYGNPAASTGQQADGSAPSAAGTIQQPRDGSMAPKIGAAPASPTTAVSLDSPAFNPDRLVSQIIQTYSIDRLMAEHKGMAREIKNLNSDMQQLVYENYNKFIAATDTIRSMKVNVDSMEADMDQLHSNMGECITVDLTPAPDTSLLWN